MPGLRGAKKQRKQQTRTRGYLRGTRTAKDSAPVSATRYPAPYLRNARAPRVNQTKGFQHPANPKFMQQLGAFRMRFPKAEYTLDFNATTPNNSTITCPNGTRGTSTIFVKGVQMWYEFENLGQIPVELHVAMCQAKEPPEDATNLTILKEGFFRDHESGTSRETDFLDSPSILRIEQKYYPINPDRWNILMRKKVILDCPESFVENANATEAYEGPRPFKQSPWRYQLNMYKKLNSWVNFNDSGDTPTMPIFVFFWATPVSTNKFGDYDSTTPIIGARGADVVFYKE